MLAGELRRRSRSSCSTRGPTPTIPTALRNTIFNLVSIATDSGLHTQDYSRWPIFAPMWMMFLSCIVASSGSTGGGIKMIRTLVLAKQAHRELDQLVHPNMVRPLKVGGTIIANRVVFAVLAFVFLYFMSIVTLVFRAARERFGLHDLPFRDHRVHQ